MQHRPDHPVIRSKQRPERDRYTPLAVSFVQSSLRPLSAAYMGQTTSRVIKLARFLSYLDPSGRKSLIHNDFYALI